MMLAEELPSHRTSVLLWVRPPELLYPEDIPGSRFRKYFGIFPHLALMSQFFGDSFHFCKEEHEVKVAGDGEVPNQCWGTEKPCQQCLHPAQSPVLWGAQLC